jgi:hypothetical protein
MGTPKKVLQPMSADEILKTLLTAQEVAKGGFREDYSLPLLRMLRERLLPLTEWLDSPVSVWAEGSGIKNSSQDRVLPFVDRWGLDPIGLTRSGKWGMVRGHEWRPDITDAEVADYIQKHTVQILSRCNWPEKEIHLNELRKRGFGYVLAHAALLVYLKQGLEDLLKNVQERIERLRLMEASLSYLQMSVGVADPFTRKGVPPLGLYSVFTGTWSGTSRRSGSYLVKGVVEKQVEARNSTRRSEISMPDYVYDESREPGDTRCFVSILCTILSETRETGQCGRDLMSTEEWRVLEQYIESL